MPGLKGGPVTSTVTRGPAPKMTPEKRLELKLAAIAVGRVCTAVKIEGDQTLLEFEDGGKINFLTPGGVRETD